MMHSKDPHVNASSTSVLKNTKKYYGNYLGVVIQNNDPDKNGRVKVWVPHISPTVYLKWTESNEDKSFRFIGRNIDSDLTDVVEELKNIVPWAVCAAPLNGSNGSGRYNSYSEKATISDSNNVDDHDFTPDYIKTKYGLNSDGVGEKPARKFEVQDLKVSDAFSDASQVPFEHANKYSYNYVPSSYSNSSKGSFSVPNVGCHVWVFFEDGDPTHPVYFAVSHGSEDWKSIYDNFESNSVDFPGSFENTNASDQGQRTINTETYRNKYVLNQKGGSFEIVNTDNRELLKMTHFSGSFLELNNYTNIEFSSANKQTLVTNDNFFTANGYNSEFVGRDSDLIVYGDRYIKVGNQNYEVFKQHKELLDPVADAKQLFEIKRAPKIESDSFSKKTSFYQSRSGDFGPCPVCSSNDRPKIWENKYSFTSFPLQTYTATVSTADFSEVVSQFDNLSSDYIITRSPREFLGDDPCPVCGGTGKSPSSYNGNWDVEEKDTFVIEKLKVIGEDLADLEKQMGRGGNEIISITKNKLENIGLTLNDFPSVRVDEVGKIGMDEIKVFDKGVTPTYKETSLIEYVHVDDLPGGTLSQTVNNKWNVYVGAGGVSIKSLGGVDIGGTITNIAGQQTNVVAEEEVNISSKVVNIAAEILRLRNKNNRQILVDGNLGVNQNVVVGGSVHVEGELSVHHITAPVELQETEPVEVYGELVSGDLYFSTIEDETFSSPGNLDDADLAEAISIAQAEGGGRIKVVGSQNAIIRIYPHTHPFKNVPLKLMKSKDDVRKVGQNANSDFRTAAIPVIHEKKDPEEID